MAEPRTPWPHAPTHQLSAGGTFCVTAGTYSKAHHFRDPERLERLHNELLTRLDEAGWRLEAWAVFSNHYHFVGHSPTNETGARSLAIVLQEVHASTGRWVNALDDTPGRRVWFNYWETRLTYHNSYLARLNYVHQNPVRHGLVKVASQYRWGSAAWFERTARPAQVRCVYGFKTDQVRMHDEF